MTEVRLRALLKGVATYVPGLREYACRSSGGTTSARYCYSVWLRHLVKAAESGLNSDPQHVAELGPGDSLGVGIAALLSGADHYFALDAKPHAQSEMNLRVFEELLRLFTNRASIPDELEFPFTSPKLASYAFPEHVLSPERLARALSAGRIEAIRRAISDPAKSGGEVSLTYMAPWDDEAVIVAGRLDMIISQAVLEHVEHVGATYRALRKWISSRGFMSLCIDFRSHGLTGEWNGHWTISDFMWKLVKGNRPYLLNRLPLSAHVKELQSAGFRVVTKIGGAMPPLERDRLAGGFMNLTDEDLSTGEVFLQAIPTP